jgi:hypothetical protein
MLEAKYQLFHLQWQSNWKGTQATAKDTVPDVRSQSFVTEESARETVITLYQSQSNMRMAFW